MQLSPFPCHLVPLRSKYSHQHPILKHPQPAFLPQCQQPGFTRETRLHVINNQGQPTRGGHLACRLDKGRTTPLRKTKNQHVKKGHTGPRIWPPFSNYIHTDVFARAGHWLRATRGQVTLPVFQNTNPSRCVGNQSPEATRGPPLPIYIYVVLRQDRCFSPLIYINILNLRTVIRLNA
jgi:hypothetical protein